MVHSLLDLRLFCKPLNCIVRVLWWNKKESNSVMFCFSFFVKCSFNKILKLFTCFIPFTHNRIASSLCNFVISHLLVGLYLVIMYLNVYSPFANQLNQSTCDFCFKLQIRMLLTIHSHFLLSLFIIASNAKRRNSK